MTRDSEPTKEQLLTMAYADGELDEAARKEFEQTMASRPDLAREVAQLQKLHVLARNAAGPEPMDFEWARLERDLLHRTGIGGGLMLILVGVVGVIGFAVWAVAMGDAPIFVKVVLGALFLGGVMMLFATLRARLRTLPYDPYTEIER